MELLLALMIGICRSDHIYNLDTCFNKFDIERSEFTQEQILEGYSILDD